MIPFRLNPFGTNRAYTPVQYLESTGTQYIDTGILIDDESAEYSVETEFAKTVNRGNDNIGYAFGNRSGISPYSGFFSYTYERSAGVVYVPELSTVIQEQKTLDVPEKIKQRIVLTEQESGYVLTFYADDALTGKTTAAVSFCSGNTVALFANKSSQTAYLRYQENTGLRVYSFIIRKNGTKLADLIPAVDSEGVACMYDAVSGAFLHNRGTGSFIYG